MKSTCSERRSRCPRQKSPSSLRSRKKTATSSSAKLGARRRASKWQGRNKVNSADFAAGVLRPRMSDPWDEIFWLFPPADPVPCIGFDFHGSFFVAMKNRFSRYLLFLAVLFCAHHLFALVAPELGSPQSADERIARLEQQVVDSKASADNAWMLTSSALVLMMTGPGLALFYCGLVRKKNVLSTMMQSFAMMALITVLWTVC